MRHPSTALSVPGYLATRSDDETDDAGPFPQAGSTVTTTNPAAKDVKEGKTSAEVGIVIGTLIAFVVISILLFLLYRRRSGQIVSPLAWWRQLRASREPAALNISNPIMGRAVSLKDRSTSQAGYDEKQNDSQHHLVPNSSKRQPKESIMQKIRQALYDTLQLNAKQDASASDMEKGQNSDSHNDGICNAENTCVSSEDWSKRTASAADMSLQTKSPTILHPAAARIEPQKETGLRAGVSAFSWSTTTLTPVPPSHPSMRENPLPPLPSVGDSRRDTTLTAMSEDSIPARHMSLGSWVASIRTRHAKREQRLRQTVPNDDNATSPVELQAPSSVANPKVRQTISRDAGSVRLSAMTSDSNVKTPALETATLAWHVHQGPEQVEVPSLPRSESCGLNQGLGLQNQWYAHSEHGPYSQEAQHPDEKDCLQQGEGYSQERYLQHDGYSQQEGEYPPEADYLQQDEQQEQESSQQKYSQQQHLPRGKDKSSATEVNSSTEITIVPKEWIPKITKYASGTTTASN